MVTAGFVCGGTNYSVIMVMADGFADVDGIGVMDHYTTNMYDDQLTVLSGKRLTGNIVIENNDTGENHHRFENHQINAFLGEGEH